MLWRVVRSTDQGWVRASDDFDDLKQCLAEGQSLAQNSDDFFAIQEMPSGAVALDVTAHWYAPPPDLT
jgi:hypothetical protein